MESISSLRESLETGFIDFTKKSEEENRPKLILNDNRDNANKKVLSTLIEELEKCDEFCFYVAFITMSGVSVLMQTLDMLRKKDIKGKIVASQYLTFTEPKALRKLLEFENIELRITQQEDQSHAKSYIFKKKNKDGSVFGTILVGSSNLTQNALCENKEWNLKITSSSDGEIYKNVVDNFDYVFENSIPVSNNWIDQYEKIYSVNGNNKNEIKNSNVVYLDPNRINPNLMQQEALQAIDELREKGKDKALLISATGTGKTYLSAFDVRKIHPKKLLFLVHREQILNQAIESYKRILGNNINMGKITGDHKDYSADYIFSTVQTMSKDYILEQFEQDHFDYIILDEAHRLSANPEKIIKYFKPSFLLGMTATPERTDGKDIFELFDHNVAYEIRLQRALQEKLLCPFHYFGITDFAINGEDIDDKTEFNKLISEERVEYIINKIKYYGFDGDRVKGLIFCSKVEESVALSEEFNKRGYKTVALSGSDSQEKREEMIEKLEKDDEIDSLDYIFTVDIFNEGIDVPAINQVVMLRPTQSAIVFTQQLGRGLRKRQGKEYLTVIDFIGNYENNFLIPIALSGDRSYNKDSIRKHLTEGTEVISGCTTLSFDEISKERIFDSIDRTNFSEMKLIKQEYENLKNMLGRIPSVNDFEKFGTIEFMRIIESSAESYYNFLRKYERDYIVQLTDEQEEVIKFISQKLINGKRDYELKLIRLMTHKQHKLFDALDKELMSEGRRPLFEKEKENVVKVLTNNFNPNVMMNKKYANSILIEVDTVYLKEGLDYKTSDKFFAMLQDEEFKDMVNELINYGLERNKNKYGNRYKDTCFELYQKYTYDDVCKILNWENNCPSINIGGYKYDQGTNTFPVFINYVKPDDVSATIDYEDRFVSPNKLIAISKNNRTIESSDIKTIYESQENDTKIYLFMRKNKNDENSKEFYFLGEVYPVGDPIQGKRKNSEDNIVEITYELDTTVREDLYTYLTC